MRKVFSYIILVLSIVAFVVILIKTQSLIAAVAITGLGLAWFLFENSFELLSMFGKDSDDKDEQQHGNDRDNTDDNPTLR
ncbi:MAG: hypothetical protein JKX84_01645 [Flavobacteriales bacterium]|nr:hypothetical protein [Flavobacteriales bacterium]